MKKSCKNPSLYLCEICDYSTKLKKDYNKHLLTRKHQNRTNSNNNVHHMDGFVCHICSKTYKSRSSLWYHKKKCSEIESKNNETEYIEIESSNIKEKDTTDKDENNSILHQVMEENKELRNMIHEQQKQIGEIIPKIGNTSNKFNINVFLNEQCKDAISLHDFIRNLQLYPEDLEETGKLGYVDGITKIISRGLQEMDLTKRPIHCSDAKREILYVKENDVWEKENIEKNRMRKAIEYISRANIKQIPTWVEQNPDSQQAGNVKNDEFMMIVGSAIDTHDGDEHDKNINKIIKNVARKVVLDKVNDT
tara:strand:+ start:347 stop:1267 length:921 start_codon:yes stop_codon:yes gene_type:complete